jgi:hypothetical protein
MEVNKALDMLKFSPKEASRAWKNSFFQPLPTGKLRMKVPRLKKATCM